MLTSLDRFCAFGLVLSLSMSLLSCRKVQENKSNAPADLPHHERASNFPTETPINTSSLLDASVSSTASHTDAFLDPNAETSLGQPPEVASDTSFVDTDVVKQQDTTVVSQALCAPPDPPEQETDTYHHNPCCDENPPPVCDGCDVYSRCGDGYINQDGEECDDGNQFPGDGCSGTCQVTSGYICPVPGEPCESIYACGNGVLEPGEICDDGNIDSGDGCSLDCIEIEYGADCSFPGQPCKLPGTCGNLRIEPGENCEDGAHDKSVQSGDGCDERCRVEEGWICPIAGEPCIRTEECKPTCDFEPFCGNGIVDQPDEVCDDGVNDGLYGTCSPDCTLAPHCGDGITQAEFGEVCDSDVEHGQCADDCQFHIVCGDGIVSRLAGEQCDDGLNNAYYSTCTADCLLAPYCGDGVVQPAHEECDDRVNNGDYNTCAPGCVLGSYCGDGIVQTPFEACDDGVNEDTSYNGGCAPGCVWAPHCGDGNVDTAFEICDDGNDIPNDHCDNECRCEPLLGI